MQTVKILSDSTCDLSPELTERFGVEIIPLHVVLGERVYEDGINITPEEIYSWADGHSDAPKTSAPSPEEIAEVYEEQLKQYEEIVSFSIASGMSASNSAMHLAAQMLDAEDRIHIIDSASLSTGIGLLVLEAAEMAQKGADGRAIAERAEALKPRVRTSFVVDTLEYLYRGGRCSGLTAFAGEHLNLHPKIGVIDGEMQAGKKYRGRIDHVILNYVRELEEDLRAADPGRVFITHSGCPKETEEAVYRYLQDLHVFREICITRAGGVVACHCGPGTLGVLFLSGK